MWEQAPNAALFGRDKSWKPHTIVVSLSAPRYDPGETTLSFNATILSRHVDRDPWVKEEEEEEAAAKEAREAEEAAAAAGGSSSSSSSSGGIGAGGTRGVGKGHKTERERAGTDEHGAAGGLAARAEATSAAAAAAGKRKHSYEVNGEKGLGGASSSVLHSKSSSTVTKSAKDKQKAAEEAEKKKKELIDLAEYTKDERRQQKKKALEKPPELELKGDAVALFVDDFSASVVPMQGFSGTNCLLPPGCLSANVCGWCPGRGGGLGGGGFGGGGFGGFGR